jgi:hypothetical protein
MGPGNMGAGLTRLAGTGRKRVAVLAAAGTVAAAAIVGLAVPAGASPVAARPAATGTEHFQIMTTSGTATTAGVIAWGVWTAAGVDHESNSSANTATDTFTFPGGTFKVTHTGKSQSGGFNAKTCLYLVGQKGTYTLHGGTGKFKGMSGHGTFTASFLGLVPKTKSGACSMTANPTAWQQVINASGPYK